ncbi:MAG: VOC family protein [Cyclobacteriaceae bacterium]
MAAYLSFNGNCKEAMVFYQHCIGGELTYQMVGASPDSGNLPRQMKDCVLEATLSKENVLLKGTDLVDDMVARGNSMTILIECRDQDEMKSYFKNLAVGGREILPPAAGFFGGLHAMLTDRFGFQWLLRST